MTIYLDLSNKPDDFEFETPPSQIWLLISLEFPVIYDEEKYLLMVQPYYGDYGSTINNGEGILYPPFMAYAIELGFFRPNTLGSARERAGIEAKKVLNSTTIDQITYSLGLGEPRHEPIGVIDEYKVSPRGHDSVKYFRIHRYRCWHPTEKGKRNITDPEGLKGHFFVPLKLLPHDRAEQARFGPHSHKFRSKVVATHFAQVKETYVSERSSQKTTLAHLSDVANFESGFLLHFDISGYGNVDLGARTRRSNPLESGATVSEKFRWKLFQHFEEFFQVLGTQQTKLTGDGFVCGCPLRYFEDKPENFLSAFQTALLGLCHKLHQMNENTSDAELSLGARIVILRGQYVYGKLGGLISSHPDFDGEMLITAARTDQALSLAIEPASRRAKVLVASDSNEVIEEVRKVLGLDLVVETVAHQVKERTVEIFYLQHAF